jgi:hypothetical protein
MYLNYKYVSNQYVNRHIDIYEKFFLFLFMITSEELLSKIILENREISSIVEKQFGSLSFDELNFKKEKNSWSVAECLDHLIVSNNQYIPLIESGLQEEPSPVKDSAELKSSFAGRFLIYSLNPENRKKLKSPRLFRPEIRVYTKEVIKVFLDQNNEIYKLMCKSRNRDLNEIKIYSPVTKLLRFNLGECFQIINVHERRHIFQAQNILASGI